VGRAIANIPGAGVVFAPPRAARFAYQTWQRSRLPEVDGIPTARLSWALAAQAALDETLLGLAKSPRWYPKDEHVAALAVELREAGELARARGWLDDPASYHRRPTPLVEPRITPSTFRGVRHELVAWESEYEPLPEEPGRDRWLGYEANRTAYARVLRHPGRERPWLVCLHGFGTGTAIADFYAFRAQRLHRDLGLNVAIPVLPLHGLRKESRLGGIEMMSFQLQSFVLGMSQAMWDVRRLVEWIRRDAGGARIGLHGMSFGAYTAALLVGLEPGFEVVVAGAPMADIPTLFASHTPPSLKRMAERNGVDEELTTTALTMVSPVRFEPLVPFERRYLYAGVGDRMSRPEQSRLLWEHWGRPAASWYQGGHMTFLWTKSVQRFVDQALVESRLVSARRMRALASPEDARRRATRH
jgi:hypothetical protein